MPKRGFILCRFTFSFFKLLDRIASDSDLKSHLHFKRAFKLGSLSDSETRGISTLQVIATL
jgi:hypothetical protein